MGKKMEIENDKLILSIQEDIKKIFEILAQLKTELAISNTSNNDRLKYLENQVTEHQARIHKIKGGQQILDKNIEKLTLELNTLKNSIAKPKERWELIVNRLIVSFIILMVTGLVGWLCDLLWHAPPPH